MENWLIPVIKIVYTVNIHMCPISNLITFWHLMEDTGN